MDCKKEFGLTDEQCEKLRFILLNRGVNKWLYARILFIELKHDVKEAYKAVKQLKKPLGSEKALIYILGHINERMQNIAKMPRWVEWGTHIHKKQENNVRDIRIKGRHC